MRILFFTLLGFFNFACSDSDENGNLIDNGAKVSIVEGDIINFGEIEQGEKVELDFNVKNIGIGDLIITDINTSCGCTVPTWPKKNIKKGETAEIKLVFDSKGKSGAQTKKVSLVTNATPSIKILTITGNIVLPEN